MLKQDEIVHYLLQSGLICSESIISGDLKVIDVSRRNCNFAVVTKQGPCFLVKQGVSTDSRMTIAREGAIYKFFQANAERGFSRYIPRYNWYDSEKQVLILELFQDSKSLRQHYTVQNRFSTTIAADIGSALGAFHDLTRDQTTESQGDLEFSGQTPWVLSMHRPPSQVMRNISQAMIDLTKIIQSSVEFHQHFEELIQGWRNETLIHNDIKSDNFIIVRGAGSERKARLKIVDWELGDSGDPCWDVGSVFSDYLGYWIFSIPIIKQAPFDRLTELARHPLGKMQPAMSAFWQSYSKAMRLGSLTSKQWLLRAVRYSAARLIQTAYEYLQSSMQITANIVCLSQLSLNILRKPQDAAVRLLGIPS